MADFLLEIGTEEIPDWMIEGALADLERRFTRALEGLRLNDGVTCETEATPRRLVLIARGLAERQQDRREILKGPPRSVAFDTDGNPTKAGEGFARRAGVSIDQLQTAADGKLMVQRTIEGRPTAAVLAEVLPGVILGISFPKTMYWTRKSGPRFIRPIRWIVALLEGQVVGFEIGGVASSNQTMGHRRLGSANVAVTGVGDYRQKLKQNYVLLSARERRKKILDGIQELVPEGLRVRENPGLLKTLVYFTEFPTAILGAFEPEFLDLPEEVLETVMQHHQRYFAIEDGGGKLQPRFIAVANLDGDPAGEIARGHARVLRARFNDARFFWDADQKQTLAERAGSLKRVTFHAKIGSYFEKTEHNRRIAKELAALAGLDAELSRAADRAAELAKTDLTTEMVGEFPELQGVVGGLYARHQGEGEDVAAAIRDHYKPAGARDALPSTAAGQIVAIADKLSTLGGLFRAGMKPTGSKDPFALRRAAYGVIRILAECELPFSIAKLSELAAAGDQTQSLEEFFAERLRRYLAEGPRHRYDEVNAVMSASSDVPLDVVRRAAALAQTRGTADFEALAASFKRIKNILKQAGGAEKFSSRNFDPARLAPGAEAGLYRSFEQLQSQVAGLKQKADYQGALTAIASLRPAVDRFFDDVLVMDKDEDVRNSRLTFLAHLLAEFSTIADFAEIVPEASADRS